MPQTNGSATEVCQEHPHETLSREKMLVSSNKDAVVSSSSLTASPMKPPVSADTNEESTPTNNPKQVLQSLHESLKKEVGRHSSGELDVERCNDLLDRLGEFEMTFPLLQETMIGKTVAALKKHESNAGRKAKKLVKRWKGLLNDYNEEQSKAAVAAAVAAEALKKKKKDINYVIQELEKKYDSLLFDCYGNQRAMFIALPKAILHLLQESWNLGKKQSVDRVSRRLVPVQSYSPNLLNKALESAGFPAPFFKQNSETRDAEFQLKVLLAEKLLEMGYKEPDQTVEFYLSFLQTAYESTAQDPHIDFDWETVQQPENETDLGLPAPYNRVAQKQKETPNTPPRSSAMEANLFASPSRASNKRSQKLHYKNRVPFVAFFPLTKMGMTLQMWKSRADHYQFNNDTSDDDGILVKLPMGVMMITRGDTIHAGGFMGSKIGKNGEKFVNGDPRGHLYIYKDGGELHATKLSNTYTLPNDDPYLGSPSAATSMRLDKVYRHCEEARPAQVISQTKYAVSRTYTKPPALK